jgi:hypothetical protein
MGDYIGIDSRGGMVYPVWTDNRSGHALAYTSPFMTGPPPGQPYIIYVSNIVNDSLGNNNGEADLGETVQLGVSVANIGDTDGENCWIKLRTTSPYISIIDSIKTIGDIRSMDTVFTPNAFKIHVASNAPDGNVAFDLIASNDTITWKSKFNLYVHSPMV